MEGPPEARGEEEPSGEVRGGRASRVCALAGGGHVSPRDVGRVPIVYPGGGGGRSLGAGRAPRGPWSPHSCDRLGGRGTRTCSGGLTLARSWAPTARGLGSGEDGSHRRRGWDGRERLPPGCARGGRLRRAPSPRGRRTGARAHVHAGAPGRVRVCASARPRVRYPTGAGAGESTGRGLGRALVGRRQARGPRAQRAARLLPPRVSSALRAGRPPAFHPGPRSRRSHRP